MKVRKGRGGKALIWAAIILFAFLPAGLSHIFFRHLQSCVHMQSLHASVTVLQRKLCEILAKCFGTNNEKMGDSQDTESAPMNNGHRLKKRAAKTFRSQNTEPVGLTGYTEISHLGNECPTKRILHIQQVDTGARKTFAAKQVTYAEDALREIKIMRFLIASPRKHRASSRFPV